jgi:methanogenic corrinoid protein MtbC1
LTAAFDAVQKPPAAEKSWTRFSFGHVRVGDHYEKKTYFMPQLMASAAG